MSGGSKKSKIAAATIGSVAPLFGALCIINAQKLTKEGDLEKLLAVIMVLATGISLVALFLKQLRIAARQDSMASMLGCSERTYQGMLALSQGLMAAAVVMMSVKAFAKIGGSLESNLALLGLLGFGTSAVMAMGCHAARSTNRIEVRPSVELISASVGFVGSSVFMAAQILAYHAAKDAPEKRTALLMTFAVATFILATACAMYPAFLAWRSDVERRNAILRNLDGPLVMGGADDDVSSSPRGINNADARTAAPKAEERKKLGMFLFTDQGTTQSGKFTFPGNSGDTRGEAETTTTERTPLIPPPLIPR